MTETDHRRSRPDWSRAQSLRLIQLHVKLGNSWTEIAKQLPGRTQNDCKNFFFGALRAKRGYRDNLVYAYARALPPASASACGSWEQDKRGPDALTRAAAYKAAMQQVAAQEVAEQMEKQQRSQQQEGEDGGCGSGAAGATAEDGGEPGAVAAASRRSSSVSVGADGAAPTAQGDGMDTQEDAASAPACPASAAASPVGPGDVSVRRLSSTGDTVVTDAAGTRTVVAAGVVAGGWRSVAAAASMPAHPAAVVSMPPVVPASVVAAASGVLGAAAVPAAGAPGDRLSLQSLQPPPHGFAALPQSAAPAIGSSSASPFWQHQQQHHLMGPRVQLLSHESLALLHQQHQQAQQHSHVVLHVAPPFLQQHHQNPHHQHLMVELEGAGAFQLQHHQHLHPHHVQGSGLPTAAAAPSCSWAPPAPRRGAAAAGLPPAPPAPAPPAARAPALVCPRCTSAACAAAYGRPPAAPASVRRCTRCQCRCICCRRCSVCGHGRLRLPPSPAAAAAAACCRRCLCCRLRRAVAARRSCGRRALAGTRRLRSPVPQRQLGPGGDHHHHPHHNHHCRGCCGRCCWRRSGCWGQDRARLSRGGHWLGPAAATEGACWR
uniref:Low-CO2 inducible Myb transcription factor LCR1 n=1 Tax=Chlamydomonas reinhardtii TaxID=3055 RepID=Q75NZ5_CHLRE|nr:low-CO2 inducible Myb transcription factor LCR1 [Chlamydomonas reinhardtii]BAD13492.1 low-CO2 inducible Myb transcription factor LCR1 [Chlamydomonas reinhardtii]